jgi:hypothetical protein
MVQPEPAAPVETKVKSATVGAALAGVLVWLLETYAFGGDVPGPVQAAVDIVVPGAAALAAGWVARHTPRPEAEGTGPPVK